MNNEKQTIDQKKIQTQRNREIGGALNTKRLVTQNGDTTLNKVDLTLGMYSHYLALAISYSLLNVQSFSRISFKNFLTLP